MFQADTLRLSSVAGTIFFRNALAAYRDADFSSRARIWAEVLANHLGETDVEDVYPAYHDPMKRICHLPEKKLRELYEALDEIYPLEVSVYFEEYLKALFEKTKPILLSQSITVPSTK